MATASTTAVAQQAVDTTLVSLIDDHLTFSFLILLEDLIHASSACKQFEALINNERRLWSHIVFPKAASKVITDCQLAALLTRVHAKECTTLLRLHFSDISGRGLLPLCSGALITLDLRQTHGPCAHYPNERTYWDGEALVTLLTSLEEGDTAGGHGIHVFLPTVMEPDSVGHPWVPLVSDEATERRIRGTMLSLKAMGQQACCMCDGSDEDSASDSGAAVEECSVCLKTHCTSCAGFYFCTACSFTACEACATDLPKKYSCDNGDQCRGMWRCDVCENIPGTCFGCGGKFCDSCGRQDDETPEAEFYCKRCEAEYWENND